jgi:hypothetical protein
LSRAGLFGRSARPTSSGNRGSEARRGGATGSCDYRPPCQTSTRLAVSVAPAAWCSCRWRSTLGGADFKFPEVAHFHRRATLPNTARLPRRSISSAQNRASPVPRLRRSNPSPRPWRPSAAPRSGERLGDFSRQRRLGRLVGTGTRPAPAPAMSAVSPKAEVKSNYRRGIYRAEIV